MPVGFDENDIHGPYTRNNDHWTSAGGNPTNQFIEWSFNTPQDLTAMYVWNHQSTQPPAANTGYDVTSFDLTLFDTNDNVLLSFDNLSLSPDSNMAQTVTFGNTIQNVSSVLFDIEAVQSSTNFTGLAEVGFETAEPEPVPEPMTILGTTVALGFGALAKSKKSQV